MAHEIFISYAMEDKPIADAVCEAIEAHGISCWYAPRDVAYGQDFEESIVDAISASRLLILILTANSNSSAHVKREIQNACLEEVGVPVLPFRTEDVPLNKALRYYIGSVHWLDAITPPLETHLQRLVEHVSARIPKPPEETESQLDDESETDETEDAPAGETDESADLLLHEEDKSASLIEEEAEMEELPINPSRSSLKTAMKASGIVLLVGIGSLLVVIILGVLTSPKPASSVDPSPLANAPANRQTNVNAANSVGSLGGLWVSIYYLGSREDEANRIAQRLRSQGVRVDLFKKDQSYAGVFQAYGEILCQPETAATCKRIAAAVSDIESLNLRNGAHEVSSNAPECYIWLAK